MSRHVVVIGGGIAGLTAAAELLKAGGRVTLLEAKARLGGRIYTVFHNSAPVELGAEFLHGQNQPMIDALQAAQLATLKMKEVSRIVLPNGKFRRVDLWTWMEKIIGKIDPRQPDCSFAQFIEQKHFDSDTRKLALAFAEGFNAARASRISSHAVLRGQHAAEHMADPSQSRIVEGYGALVKFYEDKIRKAGGRLECCVSVKEIAWERGRVDVRGQRTRARKSNSPTYRARFDAALITLPLGVLKAGDVEFHPPLTQKVEAIRDLQFGNALRVSVVFKERWWKEKDFGSVQAREEAIPVWWSDPRSPILTGWAGGPKADALLKCSRKKLGQLALAIVARAFSQSPAFLRRQLADVKTHNWARDPHVRGAYSYIPVNGLDLPKVLAAPVEGTLFFAGEATAIDAQSGTVTGAMETGLRAAAEILKTKAHNE